MNIVDSVTSRGVPYEIADARARDEKLDKSEMPTHLSEFINDIGLIDNHRVIRTPISIIWASLKYRP